MIMASGGESATQWLDDDTRVDVYALFVLDADVPHSVSGIGLLKTITLMDDLDDRRSYHEE